MRALGSVLVWLGLVAGLPSAIYAMTMVQDHEGSSTLPHDAAKCSACSLAPPVVNPAQPLLIPDETVAYVEDASDGELIP